MGSHDRERHPFVLPFDPAEIIPIPRPTSLEAAADALAAALAALGIEPPALPAKDEPPGLPASRALSSLHRRAA